MLAIIYILLPFLLFPEPSPLHNVTQTDLLRGAWRADNSQQTHILLFADGYFTHTSFDLGNKEFLQTSGGPYVLTDGVLSVEYEFNTSDNSMVGKKKNYPAKLDNNILHTTALSAESKWQRIDSGARGLYGLWQITDRKQDGKLVPIHRQGTRKTIKILSAKRFQWAAIDPGTKQFSGTGGGTYSFENGRYVENIEFFSRDGSRVGQSLSFDGKLKDGAWHHSGKSSKNEEIYEIWKRGF